MRNTVESGFVVGVLAFVAVAGVIESVSRYRANRMTLNESLKHASWLEGYEKARKL